MVLRAGFIGRRLRLVEAHQARIGPLRAVHGARPESHDKAQHACLGIERIHEPVSAVGVAHAGRAGKIVLAETRSGHALHKERHLLVAVRESAAQPVVEGRLAQRTGIDNPHRVLELLEALLGRPVARAEDGLIFAGESVAESVLQNAARPHDDRRRPVKIQKFPELLSDRLRENAVQELVCHLLRQREIALALALRHALPPEVIFNNIGIEDVRTYEEGVVGLQPVVNIRTQILNDLARREHAAGLAADHGS